MALPCSRWPRRPRTIWRSRCPPPQIPVRPAELYPTVPTSNSADLGTLMGGSDRAKPVDPSSDPARKSPTPMEHKDPAARDEGDGDCDIVEIDAVELLVEHIHFYNICGKGFKHDANLRMHMRAHGNRFKTLEALSKLDHRPEDPPAVLPPGRKTRFSCPFAGCNRNRAHRRFQPLKSTVCVKNHFRRSHCPKMYSCTRCNKKSFSVLADLKSHLKQCGEKGKEVVVDTAEEEEEAVGRGSGGDMDPEFLDDLMMDEFGMVDGTAWMDL